jgi:hypothetical protein
MHYADYIIHITPDDVLNRLDIDLNAVLSGTSEISVRKFLTNVHETIYEFVVYQTGERHIKERIIAKYREELTQSVKSALLEQVQYLIENQSDIGLWNGFLRMNSGGAEMKPTTDIISSVVAPRALNYLMASNPNLMYAGGGA